MYVCMYVCMCVTAYGFTQINQRNLWTILDWTSQIPLQMMFSSENNLREQPRRYKLTVLYKYYLLTKLLA